VKGSVAAPTAGLHFDENTLESIKSKGIKQAEVTLHVGAGTFRPIQSTKVEEHEMHSEQFEVSLKTIEKLIENAGNILSVGTTSLRTLESLYWMGLKFHKKTDLEYALNLQQWEHAEMEDSLSPSESLFQIRQYMVDNNLETLRASTQIMITPGYEFKLTDNLLTNFHQPKSTLLLLIAAFVGDDWKNIYDYALQNNFRFLSYGDSSLLFPRK
jgi:S-adenosylmethionine:tRNA ribosyltransferase-isomerase